MGSFCPAHLVAVKDGAMFPKFQQIMFLLFTFAQPSVIPQASDFFTIIFACILVLPS